MEGESQFTPTAEEVNCAECGVVLAVGQDREEVEGKFFCRPCFDDLRVQVRVVLGSQGENINYPMAVVGALLGAVMGGLVWWGFTVITEIGFGLVAVVIGFTVAKGACFFSGNKRSSGLQGLSVAVSGIAFFWASYLVKRTFILRAYAQKGQEVVLPWLPSPDLLVAVVGVDFGVMDLVFLGIVVYEAWKIPAPIRMAD